MTLKLFVFDRQVEELSQISLSDQFIGIHGGGGIRVRGSLMSSRVLAN